MKPLGKRIGAAVGDARRRRDLSQEELAERTELSRNHVSQIERGLRVPSLETMVALAGELGISLDEVVMGREAGGREASEIAAMVGAIPAELRPLVVDLIRSAARRPGRKRR